MKRILVTGGAGFLGSYLCEKLLQAGELVFCLDNFYTGQKRNIVHLTQHPHFTLIEQDVTSSLDIEIEEIYNLACPASPLHYQKDPLMTMRTCILGAMNMLELARKYRAKILQASTSEVYGDPTVHPQKESYFGNVNPIGIRACYDEGKRCAETLFFDYKRLYQLDIRLARIFNTYGPRMQQNDGRVVSNFIVQALTKQPLTLYGNGTQTRSFCYVDDLVDALIRLMKSSYQEPINLGNPLELPIQYLANLILKLTGSSSPLIYKELPSDDPKVRQPDIALAKEHLHWMPTMSIEVGLSRTIEYFTHILKN